MFDLKGGKAKALKALTTMRGEDPEWAGSGRLAILATLCLAVAVFLAKAADSTLPATDSATHADLAMSASAFGWPPRLPIGMAANGGHWGAAGYNDHPFLFFYLSGWIMRALGPDAWSAKLLPCGFSIGCVALTIALGATLRSRALGIVAAIILILSRDFVIDGLNGHLDNTMIFFILLSFIAWARGHALLAGIAAGMGVWFKTPVALLLYPVAFFYHLLRLELRERALPLLGSLFVALVTGSLIWVATAHYGSWELVRDYWVRQLWGTAVGARGATQAVEPLAFVDVLRTRFFPWSLLLAFSMIWNIATLRVRRPEFLLPLLGTLVVAVAISAIRFRYGHYFVPAYPFMALLAAQPLCFWVEWYPSGFFRTLTAGALIALTAVLCSRIEPSPESFPALRRFMAVIQSSGSCQDQVVFVNGGQPYAEFDDYAHLLWFYTGRSAYSTDCAGLARAGLSPAVAWVIVSGANYPTCLTPQVSARFPERVLDGNQILLGIRGGLATKEATGGELVDLTGLGRELKAVTDCKPAPLPQDRYHAYLNGSRP